MIDIAIVGCGEATKSLHALALRRLVKAGAIRVVALVDPAADRAKRFQRVFSGAAVFASVEDAFKHSHFAAALVASPPGFHFEHVTAALANGVHVLLEKPMTATHAQALALAEEAIRAKRVLAVGMPRRFYPRSEALAELLAAEALGSGVRFVYREGSTYSWKVASEAPFKRSMSGGGVLLDVGVHVLDAFLPLFGRGEVVECRDNGLRGGVEGLIELRMTYPRAKGTVQVSWGSPLNNGLWIAGSAGEVRVDLGDIHGYQRLINGRWQSVGAHATWPTDLGQRPEMAAPRDYYDCIYLEWVAFLRGILFGSKGYVGAGDAGHVVQLIEQAYAMSGPLVSAWLSQSEQAVERELHWRSA
jgi:predicted dehydrogenase